ncbi:MAG TPA: SRPBCC family protein [Solirubrobacteraceae bacterium]|nr:SRPBCC family protein [Solirubrobacteraceae bacterium]
MSPSPPPADVAETLVIDAPLDDVWAILSDTGRYAEWVETCLEVTYHHGEAALGGIYKEVGHGLGPIPAHTTWQVAEIDPPRYRRDTGTGMPLVSGLESIFELEPSADPSATSFTWRNRYRPALGPIGRRIDALQQGELRAMMRRSMARLAEIVTAEAQRGAP